MTVTCSGHSQNLPWPMAVLARSFEPVISEGSGILPADSPIGRPVTARSQRRLHTVEQLRPQVRASSIKALLQEWANASTSVICSLPCRKEQGIYRSPATVIPPGQEKRSNRLTRPSSRTAACHDRFKHGTGLVGGNKAVNQGSVLFLQRCADIPGSKSGRLAPARMSPLCGSMTTTAPRAM